MPADRAEIRVHLVGRTVQGKLARWGPAETPQGFTVIGDVVRADNSGGLLLRSTMSERWYCWDGQALSDLPQDATRAAIEASVLPEALRQPRVPTIPWRANGDTVQFGANRSSRWRYS